MQKRTKDLTTTSLTKQLGDFLKKHRYLWGKRPFVEEALWEKKHPEIVSWLEKLSPEEAMFFSRYPNKLLTVSCPQILQDWVKQSDEFLQMIPILPRDKNFELPFGWEEGIPVRKVQQIEGFLSCILATSLPTHSTVIDWCSGKGHLGRHLGYVTDKRVRFLERDPLLCKQGEILCNCQGVNGSYSNIDVLVENSAEFFSEDCGAIALHACGNLHIKLIKNFVQQKAAFVAVSPCCYHRIFSELHQPLSSICREASLELTVPLTFLAMSNDIHITANRREMRRREHAWRLGLDFVIRQETGSDHYQVMPSCSRKLVRGTFAEFVAYMQEKAGFSLTREWNWQNIERLGWQKFEKIEALGVVRAIFRRPLEMWLLLDLVVFLEENGALVEWGTFCNYESSARNFLVIGKRNSY